MSDLTAPVAFAPPTPTPTPTPMPMPGRRPTAPAGETSTVETGLSDASPVIHERGRARATTKNGGFIVGPVFDLTLFVLSPVWALALGGWASQSTDLQAATPSSWRYDGSWAELLLGTLVMAHVVAVFFRSHGNRAVFATHPVRFTAVPLALMAAMLASPWVLVSVSVLATWWDVYHSGLQTFGLGRIYDMQRGNAPAVGRRLDMALNHLLYVGPILAGATLMDHVEDFSEFEEVGGAFFTAIPAQVESVTGWLTWAVVALAVPLIVAYVLAYRRHARAGYHVSWQKVLLLANTALVSLFAWGFNSFGEAFLIMNVFHAVQYLALVWIKERDGIRRLFRLERMPGGRALALLAFLAVTAAYGAATELFVQGDVLFAAVLTVSVLHFWYDGFIWSVRRGQV